MKKIAFSAALGVAIALVAACSDDSTSSSSSSSKCCLNGGYYECTPQDVFSHCGKTDVDQFCPRTSSKDDQCK